VAKSIANQTHNPKAAERAIATPAQFLPSMMLSWRTPIMARAGLPAGRKVQVKAPSEPGKRVFF
jgi:hypothetical protein